MKLRFSNASVWKYVITSISKIIEEGVFRVDQSGLRLRAFDATNTAFIDLHIPREAFVEFNVEKEEKFGVNFEDFAKISKLAAKGDELLLELVEGGRLGVTFQGHGTRTFILPNIEVSPPEEVSEISLEFPVKARIQPALFDDIMKELDVVGDVLTLESQPDSSILALTASSDIAEARIELSLEDGSLLEYTVNSEAKASYGLEYLYEMSRVAPVAEGLVLEYGSNLPLKLLFELPQGGRIVFYVSPRVE
ncbi:DNA polymerase sliding clamp [Thermogladius sp. 4427co]|uniref:DNA polymerase sliding clamp n=1 Tax=Thermogladius sp. 4427co TaxID=3450718 RepID=UPI003F7B2816